jgi:DNA polymerase III delta prime subunit
MLSIHNKINTKLDYFIEKQKIPNIIFHGPPGAGKRTLTLSFIGKIYNNDKNAMKKYLLHIDCGHGKGIKFIREDLKFFAKTNIAFQNGVFFKSVLLLNADKLTTDAQSALRRCIELFSHNTRFFIVIENKFKLLKPILSRFCEIYIPLPVLNNQTINLHDLKIKNEIYDKNKKKIYEIIKKSIKVLDTKHDPLTIIESVENLYDKGISVNNLIEYFKNNSENINFEIIHKWSNISKEIKNEKIILLFILNNYYFRSDLDLENISFM